MKNKNGVTLIALIITIIVLLILAGVTISAIAGRNGVLTQAEQASIKTKIAQAQEAFERSLVGVQGDYYNSHSNIETEADYITLEKLNKSLEDGYKLCSLNGDELDNENKSKNLADYPNIYIKDDSYVYVVTYNLNLDKSPTNIKVSFPVTWKDNGNFTYTSSDGVTVTIGDIVNYNPLDGAKKTEYISHEDQNGNSDQKFVISSYTGKWKILDVDSNGNLELISTDTVKKDDNTGFSLGTNRKTLKAESAYINGPTELDNIGNLYGQGNFAKYGRSITVDDINNITGYNPETAIYGAGEMWEYGNKVTYYWQGPEKNPYCEATNGKSCTLDEPPYHMVYGYFRWFDGTKFIESKKSLTASEDSKEKIVDLTSTYYSYYPETLSTTPEGEKSINGNKSNEALIAYDLLFNENYWLNSQQVWCGLNGVTFGLRYIENKAIGGLDFIGSNHDAWDNKTGRGLNKDVRPIIVLNSNTKLTKTSDGSYSLYE